MPIATEIGVQRCYSRVIAAHHHDVPVVWLKPEMRKCRGDTALGNPLKPGTFPEWFFNNDIDSHTWLLQGNASGCQPSPLFETLAQNVEQTLDFPTRSAMTILEYETPCAMTSAQFPDLKDASVFVTGGASGIGATLVEGFAAQGAKVAFVDLLDGTDTADGIGQRTGNVPLALQADVTDIAALKAAINTAAETNGTITVLVNNAALDERKGALDVDEAHWDKMQAINLKHQFFAAQAVVPGMQAAGGGRIVNFSSISYMMGMGDYPAYTSAKAGITALTRSFAREFGRDSIRVNAVMPGWVLTPRQMELWASPEALDAFKTRMCLPEHLKPEDMVGPVLFLASEASSVMTGQALVVDGGVVVTG